MPLPLFSAFVVVVALVLLLFFVAFVAVDTSI